MKTFSYWHIIAVAGALSGTALAQTQAGGAAGTGTVTTPGTSVSTPVTADPTNPASKLPPTVVGDATPLPAPTTTPTPGEVDPATGIPSTAPATGLPAPGSTVPSVPSTSPGSRPIGPDGTPIGGSVTIPQAGPVATPGSATPAPRIPTTIGAPAPIIVNAEPPPRRPESMGTPPSPNHMWVPGHHTWQDGQWNWVDGTWIVPPQNNVMWVDGQFDPATRRWVEGHWEPIPSNPSR